MGNPLLTIEELNALKALPGLLETEYRGSNKERKAFIEFAKKLSEDPALLFQDEAPDILMGAYLFMMEYISSTYTMRSAQNSSLYALIDKHIQKINHDTAVTKVDKVIYLASFYRYLQTNAPENLAKETQWVSNDSLIRELVNITKRVLWKQDAEVKCLLESLPKYSLLCNRLANMEERYLKDCPKPGYFSMFSPPNGHQDQAKFIDAMTDYTDTYLSKITDPNFDPALEANEAYLIRVGIVVSMLKSLEEECTVSSAHGRNLYEKCKAVMNIYDSNSIDLDYKISGLDCLKLHLTTMLKTRKDFIAQKVQNGYPKFEDDIKKMRKVCADSIAKYTAAQTAPSTVHSGIASVAGNVAKAVMSTTVPNPGSMMDATAAMTGFAVLGPGGAILGTTLSRLVRSQLLPLAFATMFTRVLEKVSSKVGNTAAHIVIFPFECTARGLSALVNRYGDSFDQAELRRNIKWIEALMSLPDDVMAKQKKDVIANVTGLSAPTMPRYA